MPKDSRQRSSSSSEPTESTVLRPASFSHVHPALQFTHPLPYGALLHDDGVQFVVFSRSATNMRLLLYDRVDDREPTEIIPFDRETDRWGDTWSIFVPGLSAGQLYHFQAEGPF